MKRKTVMLSSLAACLLLFSIPNFAFADSAFLPVPYRIDLPNSGRAFYMTPDDYLNPDLSVYSEGMLESGLYDTSDNMKCLYTVSDYINESGLLLSSDGVCFAVMYSMGTEDTEVIGFYRNGLRYKIYTVSELMADIGKRVFSSSHYQWQKWNEHKFDIDTGILSITTLDDVEISFDIKTGEMLSRNNPNDDLIPNSNPNHYMIYILTGGCILSVATLFLIFRRKKRNSLHDSKEGDG